MSEDFSELIVEIWRDLQKQNAQIQHSKSPTEISEVSSLVYVLQALGIECECVVRDLNVVDVGSSARVGMHRFIALEMQGNIYFQGAQTNWEELKDSCPKPRMPEFEREYVWRDLPIPIQISPIPAPLFTRVHDVCQKHIAASQKHAIQSALGEMRATESSCPQPKSSKF